MVMRRVDMVSFGSLAEGYCCVVHLEMPTVRVASSTRAGAGAVPTGVPAASGETTVVAVQTAQTVQNIASIRPSLAPINVKARVMFKSGVSKSYPAVVVRVADDTGAVLVKASSEGMWADIAVDDLVEISGLRIRPAYLQSSGVELHYDQQLSGTDTKRRRSASL